MNFFKKYWFIISIILFFSIVIIIGFFKGVNETKKGSKSLSNHHKEVDNKQKPNQPLRNKHEIDPPQLKKQITNDKESNQLSSDHRESETPKPKIKITQEKYNKIKSYILSENDNEVLSLKDLSQEKKTEIEKIKNSWGVRLGYLNKEQKEIDKIQEECNNLIAQRDSAINQIQQLQKQLQPKEAELETQNKEIDKLKFKKQQKQTQLQTQGQTTYKNSEIDLIQNEISKLQDEKLELVGQIEDIELQIGHLKSDQTMYENMLSRAQNYKKDLEKDYNKSLEQNKQSALSSLNSLYEITSDED
ncbi:Hypothetical Protein yibP [Candidatus Phytoplasma pruni]|uniref:Uncharacterized protein n=1 Tax=Candidatus Phytoplasma pruni TaxID=479893 RepID=A0A0M1MZ77_9MOLU|nr:hypothetical protein [Candidatus Phytoplasma pruni]KOR75217.1 Hypothetical Protein yibP [Candidatus Phytoplasma pruni]